MVCWQERGEAAKAEAEALHKRGRKDTWIKRVDNRGARSDIVMRRALREKFVQNPTLRRALVQTRKVELAEQGRGHGEYWTHTGANMLGKMLMELRDEFSKENI